MTPICDTCGAHLERNGEHEWTCPKCDAQRDTETKTQHTPGPWEVRFDMEVITDATGLKVCDIEPEYRTVEQSDANARLIAAAPELLEALRGLGDSLGCVDRCFEQGLQRHSPACEQAKAAIAKAEGRS